MEWDGFHAVMQRAQAGDRQAQDEVFSRVRSLVQRRASQLLGGRGWKQNSVLDLAAETEERALRHLQGFKGGANDEATFRKFRKWILTILRTHHLNRARQAHTKGRSPPGPMVRIRPTACGDSSSESL